MCSITNITIHCVCVGGGECIYIVFVNDAEVVFVIEFTMILLLKDGKL